ncbi:hypothetical protein KIPB_007790, partial [Kipferlia bialata]|eukprot:g7790.t1
MTHNDGVAVPVGPNGSVDMVPVYDLTPPHTPGETHTTTGEDPAPPFALPSAEGLIAMFKDAVQTVIPHMVAF